MSFRQCLLLMTALLAASSGLGAEKAPPAKAPAPPSQTPPATSPASPSSKPSSAAEAASVDRAAVMQQFKEKSDALLAERAKAIEALKTASEAEKKKILAGMEADQKKLIEAQRALGKQIRDDMRKLRQAAPAASPGGRR